jgi:hypothetical protein
MLGNTDHSAQSLRTIQGTAFANRTTVNRTPYGMPIHHVSFIEGIAAHSGANSICFCVVVYGRCGDGATCLIRFRIN